MGWLSGVWKWYADENGSGFGHDKSLEIRPYANLPAEERPTLFYAGDGVSDLSAAKETDLLFAKAGRGMLMASFGSEATVLTQEQILSPTARGRMSPSQHLMTFPISMPQWRRLWPANSPSRMLRRAGTELSISSRLAGYCIQHRTIDDRSRLMNLNHITIDPNRNQPNQRRELPSTANIKSSSPVHPAVCSNTATCLQTHPRRQHTGQAGDPSI